MNTRAKQATAAPVLSGTEAQLYVADIKVSCDFFTSKFTSKLGFAIDFVYSDPPLYGMVKRDRARLCVRRVCEPVFVGDIRQREHLLSAAPRCVDKAIAFSPYQHRLGSIPLREARSDLVR
jgi:hypothetical protein